MGRFFNTAGPIHIEDHYNLPPLSRIDLDAVMRLIDQKQYLALYAPRQTGKTSVLLALSEYLRREGRYACAYANLEPAQASRENLDEAMWGITGILASSARVQMQEGRLVSWIGDLRKTVSPNFILFEFLRMWSEASEKPVILLLDEVDALVGDTLISLLRQLRSGYAQRPAHFPQSVVLCGVRDVRDYRIHSSSEKAVITGGSAFNVKARSFRVGDFQPDDVALLYRQHTEATGQHFEDEALEAAFTLTQGQPWLVNALAYEVCFRVKPHRDGSVTITKAMIEDAKEALIQRRDTHLDQLLDKLTEPRVRRVMEPILSGTDMTFQPNPDDVQYAIDLGLVSRRRGTLEVANPIYREIVPRELTDAVQLSMGERFQTPPYLQADGRLNINKLLGDFQTFFREGAESWTRRFLYEEAGVQLLLQAFLQRIVNGGGRVEREYALGRKRTDLLVRWPLDSAQCFHGPLQQVVIELKILHGALEVLLPEALAQTAAYLDRTGADEGHIVVVDKSKTRTWDEKLFRREEVHDGRSYVVWGM